MQNFYFLQNNITKLGFYGTWEGFNESLCKNKIEIDTGNKLSS